MDPAVAGGGGAAPPELSAQSLSRLSEGIGLVFAQWTALQMAIENQWGGKDSRRKADELASNILSWFSQSKGPLYIDDLEEMLDVNIVGSFNMEIEDGSVEEVAEQLMVMHEDCLKGNYKSIEKLRSSIPAVSAVSQSKRVADDDDDDDDDEDESSDEEDADMMVDEPKPTEMVAEKSKQKQVADEDGWYTVTSRRSRGKK